MPTLASLFLLGLGKRCHFLTFLSFLALELTVCVGLGMKIRLRFASSKPATEQRPLITFELPTACMMLTQTDHSNWGSASYYLNV